MTKLIISAHYNENLDWTNNISIPIKIYSKTHEKYNFIQYNKGQEVPCFLTGIIDNYHNCPDKLLFIHGHQTSPHQDYDIDFIINNLKWELSSYFSINKRAWYQEVSEDNHIEKHGYNWIKNNWNIFHESKLPLPKKLKFYSGAQFVVNKDLITQYSIDFYKSLLEWVQTTNLENYASSRLFEYTWHYFFAKNQIEPKKSSFLFL